MPAPLAFHALDLERESVRARFEWGRSAGHPYWLWPDVPPASWRRALASIGDATARVLSGEPRVSLNGESDVGALGIAAYTSGMGPLLGHWIERGTLEVRDDVARVLLLHLEHGRARAQRIRERFADAADRLAAVGVRPTVVKGWHTAHAVFPEPGTRPVSDVDLVVVGAALPLALSALSRTGLVRRDVIADPHMSEWTEPGETGLPRSLELTHVENPWGIDLHGSFDRDYGGARRVAVVPDHEGVVEPWPAGGATLDVLAQPWLVAYLAAHASQELKNLTLVRLVELVWVIRDGLDRRTLDWDRLRVGLPDRGALGFLYPALELAERLAPGTLDPRFRSAVVAAAPERVRRIVSALDPWAAQRLDGVSLREQFMWASGPRSYLGRVGRALWPAWAGGLPQVLRIQMGRVRQLIAGRVAMGRGREGP